MLKKDIPQGPLCNGCPGFESSMHLRYETTLGTQCDVEIESWNTQAYLWVKVPTINAGAATVLYLYYDATQPDNTAYVGDIGW